MSITKKGFVKKLIRVETYVPKEDIKTYTFTFNVDIFEKIEKLDVSVLERPISRIRFRPLNKTFDYDKEYTAKVKNREIYDMALTFHLKNGVEFINENPNFCKEDIKSAGHGVIIGVPNPSFDPERAIYPERANIFELV